MEAFPELLREPCRTVPDLLMQFNFLLNIRLPALACCSVIRALKDHHSSGLLIPGSAQVKSSSVLGC